MAAIKKTFAEVIQQLIQVNDDLIAGKIDIEKAKQIAQISQILINAAKVEVEYAKLTNRGCLFLSGSPLQLMLPEPEVNIPDNKRVITAHYLAGVMGLNEPDSLQFFKYCTDHKIFTRADLGDGKEHWKKFKQGLNGKEGM